MKIEIVPNKPEVKAGQVWSSHNGLYLIIHKSPDIMNDNLLAVQLQDFHISALSPKSIANSGTYIGNLEVK